ncbi:hypothetical protein D3C80_1588550 [compost metagenome]
MYDGDKNVTKVVHQSPFDRNAAPQLASGKIQDIFNQVVHPLRALSYCNGKLLLATGGQLGLQQISAHSDSAQWRTEVMPQYGNELLPDNAGLSRIGQFNRFGLKVRQNVELNSY